jgi:hypothetical protein
MANHFTRGQTFQDGQANGVTAAKLHALIESAVLTIYAITEQSEEVAPASGDMFLIYDASSGTLKKLDYANTALSPTVFTGYRNLLVINNAGSATTTVDVTADDVVLKNGSGVPKYHSGVTVSANITVSGANGLDTGAEAASTWYYLWLISDGTTIASLLSTSATAPTMPGLYTYKALVGGVYNNGSSNFWTFRQVDDIYYSRQVHNNFTWTATTNADSTSATGYLTYAMDGSSSKPFVPANAVEVMGNLGRTDANVASLCIAGSTAGLGANIITSDNIGTAMDSFTNAGSFRVPLATAQTVFLKSATALSDDARISLSGFRLKR